MAEPLDLTALRAAVASLESALAAVGDSAWVERQTEAVRNTLTAGVVQNVEFVYEVSVKMIRRRLVLDAASAAEIEHADFRTQIRLAAERGLVEDVEAWFRFRKLRNLTSHTYDRAVARTVADGAGGLLDAARALLARLEERNDA